MPNPPTHDTLLINHLERILFDKANAPEHLPASIAELRDSPTANGALQELLTTLGTPVVIPAPTPAPVPTPNPDTPPTQSDPMFFQDKFNALSVKLDEIISLLKAKATPSGGGEVTSPAMAKLAAKVLKDKKSTKLNRRLAGALLTQAPNRQDESI